MLCTVSQRAFWHPFFAAALYSSVAADPVRTVRDRTESFRSGPEDVLSSRNRSIPAAEQTAGDASHLGVSPADFRYVTPPLDRFAQMSKNAGRLSVCLRALGLKANLGSSTKQPRLSSLVIAICLAEL